MTWAGTTISDFYEDTKSLALGNPANSSANGGRARVVDANAGCCPSGDRHFPRRLGAEPAEYRFAARRTFSRPLDRQSLASLRRSDWLDAASSLLNLQAIM